jgi:phage tail sheath protein FI
MHNLFTNGAFQGASARDAYFVRCDSTTTTQADIDRGIVNVIVGFAPLKPAEFVVLSIQQIVAQS